MAKTQLINGFLPPETECPMDKCLCARIGSHLGKDHKVRFSCAALRMYACTTEGKERIEEVVSDDPMYQVWQK